MKDELERIALLARRFERRPEPVAGVTTSTGIGDDAAVLELAGAKLVWTIDAQVEGTHFRSEWASWADVGWRSFMAAASDLAAMGANPVAALSALVLQPSLDDLAFDALTQGQADAALAVGAAVIGGNLARGTETSVTTTLLGRVDRPILRSGTRAGDGVYLAGPVGLAAAGLAALSAGARSGSNVSVDACIDAWRRPRALIEEGLSMRATATAAVDVSDGLARDSHHIAEASLVTLVLEERELRARGAGALEAAAALLGRDALELMLEGGEDYALLVTSPSPIEGFDRVGTVESGGSTVVLARMDGSRSALAARGFDHFR